MRPNKYSITAFVFILFFASFIYLLKFTNIFIEADSAESANFCSIVINGEFNQTHVNKNGIINLGLFENDRLIKIADLNNSQYLFNITNHVPNENWQIIAIEEMPNGTFQYPLVKIADLKCNSNNFIDIQN